MARSSRDASVCDLGGLAVKPQTKTEPTIAGDLTRSFFLVSLLALAFIGSAAATFTIV